MDALRIEDNGPLTGNIKVSGSKNAALPLMASVLLTDQHVTFRNLPHLADITTMTKLLSGMGVEVVRDYDLGHATFNAASLSTIEAPYDMVRRMRASILVLGPLLARHGRARVSLPGGCAIGTRPVDLHLKAMERLGAQIELKDGYVEASAPDGLQGGRIRFSTVSVGGTENALMAASLAKGTTIISNAAREPEIVDLASCLRAMGALIQGDGGDEITIEGVGQLGGAIHDVIPDRIEAGTFMLAAVGTRGKLMVEHARAEHLSALMDKLEHMNVHLEATSQGILVDASRDVVKPVDVDTQPHPGFPTDLQAQIMAVLTQVEGDALLTENIFENRFMHVPELLRMGADITLKGSNARVRGVERLKGAPVMATDLRASVSLVMAGLAASGTTIVRRVYHLDRGYEAVEKKLRPCGALIERFSED